MKKIEQVTDEWIAEEDLARPGMEGEENGYTEGAMEGPGWEGDSGDVLEDLLQEVDEAEINEAPTFLYGEGEHRLVEEENTSIADQVKEHRATGGHLAVGTPPS